MLPSDRRADACEAEAGMPLEARHGFRWIEHGNGAPVVFLSGLFGEPADWAPSLGALGVGYRSLVPDVPVFEPAIAAASIPEVGRYVERFLDALGVDSAILGGNSLGGQVAIDLALVHPARVRGLVLTGASGIYDRPVGRVPRNPSRSYVAARIADVIRYPEHLAPERVEAVERALSSRSTILKALRFGRAARLHDLADRLSEVDVPALLVWGADDRITPPEVAERFQRLLPHAKLVVLERTGHAPMFERPIEFGAAVQSWLQSIDYVP